MTHNAALMILLSALEQPYGIAVKTNNAETLRQKLYAARATEKRKTGTEMFLALTFRTCPENPTEELWIVNNTTTTPEQDKPHGS